MTQKDIATLWERRKELPQKDRDMMNEEMVSFFFGYCHQMRNPSEVRFYEYFKQVLDATIQNGGAHGAHSGQ